MVITITRMFGIHAPISEILSYEREVGNIHDTLEVAIKKEDNVVGHFPRRILALCSIFIRCGNKIISHSILY